MKLLETVRSGLWCASMVAVLFAGASAWAHPGMDTQIADISLRIEKQPDDPDLRMKRGELHRIHGDWKAAETDFRQARKLDPKLAIVDFLMGRMKMEAGHPGEAKVLLDRFVAARPDHAKGWVARARTSVELGQPLAAAKDYTSALAAIGQDGRAIPAYYLERARALADAGTAHLEDAIRGLDEGLVRLGRPVTLQLYAIELELTRGRHDAALARLDRVAAQANRQESWLVRRGEILESAGRAKEAGKAYESALKAIETLPSSRRNTRAVKKLQDEARAAIRRLSSDG